MEKEQHPVPCKTAEILEFYTLQNQVMNKKKNSNKWHMYKKQHFSFNSRKESSPSEVFFKNLTAVF